MTARPDLLVVVVDCARADAILSPRRGQPGLPNLNELRAHGLTFEKALSPSSWTIPSHASLLTGLYPWEHGSLFGEAPLSNAVKTVAQAANQMGYRTGSFSANQFINDLSGLTRGFEVAKWGTAGASTFRGLPKFSPPQGTGTTVAAGRLGRISGQEALRPLIDSFLESFPEVPDIAVRVSSAIKRRELGRTAFAAPWIEPAIRHWLAECPRTDPVFCFVNLLDAHEPYFGLPDRRVAFGELIRYWRAFAQGRRTPQRGLGRPDEESLSILRGLYDEGLGQADLRLGAILEAFRQFRDSENLAVLLTGDHGQAFGEAGAIFHSWGVADELFRVPLIVRPASKLDGPDSNPEWISIKSVASFALSFMEGRADNPLNEKGPTDRGQPVWAFTNVWQGLASNGQSRRFAKAPVRVIGYLGSSRVIVNAETGEPEYNGPVSARSSEPGRDEIAPEALAPTLAEARRIGTLISKRQSVSADEPETRLRGWGYE